MRVNYVIIFVTDMQRSTAFYRDVFGLSPKFDSSNWTEFHTEGATVALHLTGTAATNEDQDHLPAGGCRPGFGVPDLDEFHLQMVEKGVRCLEEPREVFGARLALYADPDGLAISVGEGR